MNRLAFRIELAGKHSTDREGKIRFTRVTGLDYWWAREYRWNCMLDRIGGNFYARRGREHIPLHDDIARRMGLTWDPTTHSIDHINQDTLDNRRTNLRVATRSEQQTNRGMFKNNKSGVTGVTWNAETCKWKAQIQRNYKQMHLGYFGDFDEAVAARKAAELRL